MKRETILEETRDRVRTLVMNRPEARNAFNVQMWTDLRDALADARSDDAVHAVVLTGTAGAFTAGQDLGEMTAPPGGGEHPFGSCMQELIEFDKPLLAAVNGVGVGFGLTALLHCDVVYFAKGARVRVPFVELGVVPEAASSYLLPLVVGPQRAAEILYGSDWVTSEQAVEIGLAIGEVEPEELLPTVHEAAAKIAQYPLGSLRHSKRLVKAPLVDGIREARAREDAAFAERIGSPENVEAIKAFFAKRNR